MFRFLLKNWASKPIDRRKKISETEISIKSIKLPEPIAKEDSAQSLEELYTAINTFNGCSLKNSSHSSVIFSGDAQSPLMIIGEAPGQEEDMAGKPFVGASGKLLDKMLAAANISRDKVYVTNVVFWRPPQNRKPTEEEISLCLPFVKQHIKLQKPKFILGLGATALFALTGKKNISSHRTLLMDFESIPLLVTFHPSYILRMPQQKAAVWHDLKVMVNYMTKEGLFSQIALTNYTHA